MKGVETYCVMEKQQVAKPEFRTALISVENGERREREQCCCLFRFSLVPSGWWEKFFISFFFFFFSLASFTPQSRNWHYSLSRFFSLSFNDERGELPIISIPFHAAWLENHRNGVMWNNGSCTRCCASLLFVIQLLPHLLTRI